MRKLRDDFLHRRRTTLRPEIESSSNLEVEVILDIDLASFGLDAEQMTVLFRRVLRELVDYGRILSSVPIACFESEYYGTDRDILRDPDLQCKFDK